MEGEYASKGVCKLNKKSSTQVYNQKYTLAGSVHMKNLPDGRELSDLDRDHLSGSIDFSALSASMNALYLNDNSFGGIIRLETLSSTSNRCHLKILANEKMQNRTHTQLLISNTCF
ncbi:hypothetical protein XU18_4811 [Perkinsela sp. CCAP 1560/4]|nr:hypothetical protein XU18_4811 [Perkinsela sp. CCAP 1560/4]|eukprot:KNH03857.1 hypothetical protein XU18_4811 [Perkinsela sp. CCAP 1560/4]